MSRIRLREASLGQRQIALRWWSCFTIINSLLMALGLCRYLDAMGPIAHGLAKTFLAIAVPAHGFTLALIASLPLLALSILWPRRQVLTGLGVLLMTLALLILAVDSVVYKLYRFHLNGMVWELLTGGAAGEILPFSVGFWSISFVILGAIILCEWLAARVSWIVAERNWRFKTIMALAVICLVGVNAMHAWANAVEYSPIVKLVRHLPAFKPLTAKRTLRKLGFDSDKIAIIPQSASNHGTFTYPLNKVSAGAAPSGLNVLYILVDGWRYSDFSPEVTPNIWKFGTRSQVFSNHYSTGNATRYGVFGFFYGIFGTYWDDVIAEQRPPVVIETARRQGYKFGAFASAPLTSPEFDRTVFISVRDNIQLKTEGGDVVERDARITKQFEDFVDDVGEQPFFGFLFYDSSHSYSWPQSFDAAFEPYSQRINHLTLDEDTDRGPILNRLRNSYHFIDSLVGRVLTRLEEKGLVDNTLIVISSDHGEEVNDSSQNFWGHNSAFNSWQLHVPLIISLPGQTPEILDHRTSHTDIAPTVMQTVFASEAPVGDYSNGRNLFENKERPFVLSASWNNFAVISPDSTEVSFSSGDYEVRDPGYNLIPDATPNTANMIKALHEMGRFYQ